MALSIEARVAIISGTFGVLAALLSAVISWQVAQMQVAAEREKLRLEDRVARARLFQTLIKDLEKDGTANYALLALWQLYKDEKDRKIILAAALQNPDQKTLHMLRTLGLQKELAPYFKEIEALIKDSGAVSTAARELLVDVEPERYLLALLEQLQSDKTTTLVDQRIQEIRFILAKQPTLESLVSKKLDKNRPNYTTIAIALYLTGNKSTLKEQIGEIKRNPGSNFARMAYLVAEPAVHLEESDWRSLANAAATVVNGFAAQSGGGSDVQSTKVAVQLLKHADFQPKFLKPQTRGKLTESLEKLLLHPELDAVTKADIAVLLFTFDRKKAVVVLAMAKACNKINRLVDVFLEDILKKIRTELPHYPADGSKREEWRKWYDKNADGRAMTC